MPISRTRPRDHGVLTDCPTELPRACTSGGAARRTGESHVARVDRQNPAREQSRSVPTRCPLSDENSRGKVQNVCGDSPASLNLDLIVSSQRYVAVLHSGIVKKKKQRFHEIESGTCQHECDVCRASCGSVTYKCARWVNHKGGHVCLFHAESSQTASVEPTPLVE